MTTGSAQHTPSSEAIVAAVVMPQVNVNDQEVTLLGWLVEDGGHVLKDQPLCEVETSKSVGELPAPGSGIFRQAVPAGEIVAIGQTVGYLGPTLTAIEQHLADAARSTGDQATACAAGPAALEASAGAIELAMQYGIDLAEVPAKGRIRRADVEQYLATHRAPTRTAASHRMSGVPESLPPSLASLVVDEGDLPDHAWAIARHLGATRDRLVTAHVMMDVTLTAAHTWIANQRRAGQMVSLLPLLLHAAAAAVQVCPKLGSFRLGRRVYRYPELDIAYTARSADGRLFTPVVRGVDRRPLDDLANECARLNMGVFRGQLNASELAGGCLTVSALMEQPVRFHLGLQNAYQSALITAGSAREELALVHGKVTARPVTTLALSYDHGLLDGWEAAAALEAVKTALEAINVS
ncbi:MAG: hypothetical protein GXY55_16535 [Phycisphaerae bacterium]|nr:hypothetical protein [Phycisphaerae bacterium]